MQVEQERMAEETEEEEMIRMAMEMSIKEEDARMQRQKSQQEE